MGAPWILVGNSHHDWRLRCHLSGCNPEERGSYTSIFLELLKPQGEGEDPQPDIHVSTEVAFVMWGDGEESPRTRFDFRCDFKRYGYRFGFPTALSVADAKSSYVGPEDRLTIRCELQVTAPSAGAGAATTAPGRIADIDVPPGDISWHLEQLLERRLGSDVAFLVDHREFHARSLILSARSPLLLKEVEEAQAQAHHHHTKKIEIEGIDAPVFKALLHFIYTDELPPLHGLCAVSSTDRSYTSSIVKMAGELLAAAERYQLLERMVPMCDNLLCDVTTPETSAAVLMLAERHHHPELKAFCVDYMASPDVLKAVVRTEAYRELLLNGSAGQVLGDIMERMLTLN